MPPLITQPEAGPPTVANVFRCAARQAEMGTTMIKRITLTTWIFIARAVGVGVGLAMGKSAENLAPISNIFLRLIKSIVAPLLFGTLVYGMAGGGHNPGAMGRIGLKAI